MDLLGLEQKFKAFIFFLRHVLFYNNRVNRQLKLFTFFIFWWDLIFGIPYFIFDLVCLPAPISNLSSSIAVYCHKVNAQKSHSKDKEHQTNLRFSSRDTLCWYAQYITKKAAIKWTWLRTRFWTARIIQSTDDVVQQHAGQNIGYKDWSLGNYTFNTLSVNFL